MSPVAVGPALRYGWAAFKAHSGLMLGLTLIVFALGLTNSTLQNSVEGFVLVITSVVGYVVLQAVYLGYIRAVMQVVDDRGPSIGALAERLDQLLAYIVATIVFSVLAALLSLLLIIPGVIYAVAHAFYGFSVVDRDHGPFAALRHSREITRGHRWGLFGFCLVAIGVNFLGALALGVGLLVTVPVTALAFGYIYAMLSRQPAGPPATAVPGAATT